MIGRYLLFIFISISFYGYGQNADINLLKNINKYRNNSFEGYFEFVNNSDYIISGTIPIAQFVTGYAIKNRQLLLDARQMVIGYGYSALVTYLYKYSIQKQRPSVAYSFINSYQTSTDPSFPSGHTSLAFSAATSLSLCYPRWYVYAPAFFWAGSVAYSQMYLGMHYPTDILFGALIGAGSAWLSIKTTDWLNINRESRTLISF